MAVVEKDSMARTILLGYHVKRVRTIKVHIFLLAESVYFIFDKVKINKIFIIYYVDWRNISGKDGPHPIIHIMLEPIVRVFSKSIQIIGRQLRGYLL